MNNTLLDLLSAAYATVSFIGLIAYWPTIKDLYHHKKASANISSYVMWTSGYVITLLYSIFVLPDLLFQIVTLVNLVACATVLFLSIALSKK
ncbi:hypothetical protein KBD59_05140 [Candidatus Gracilibacteria bacterium]|nr:hypothetical protein [Candidatus Gracilibacteria bacterium]